MGHFRVELHAVVATGVVEHAGDRAARGAGQHVEVAWHLGDLVAVAHPHVQAQYAVIIDVVFDAVEQAALADYVNAGIAELAQVGTFDLAAHLLGHGLHAVADAQQRNVQVEDRLRCARAVGFVDRLGAASEDDAARIEFADRFIVHVERVQFAVDTDLAHAAGDQLGVLGTEIEDQDAVSVNVEGHDSISSVEIGTDAGLS